MRLHVCSMQSLVCVCARMCAEPTKVTGLEIPGGVAGEKSASHLLPLEVDGPLSPRETPRPGEWAVWLCRGLGEGRGGCAQAKAPAQAPVTWEVGSGRALAFFLVFQPWFSRSGRENWEIQDFRVRITACRVTRSGHSCWGQLCHRQFAHGGPLVSLGVPDPAFLVPTQPVGSWSAAFVLSLCAAPALPSMAPAGLGLCPRAPVGT